MPKLTYAMMKREAERRGLLIKKYDTNNYGLATPMLGLDGKQLEGAGLVYVSSETIEDLWADIYYAGNKASRDIRVAAGQVDPEHPTHTWTKWNLERYHGHTSLSYGEWVKKQELPND